MGLKEPLATMASEREERLILWFDDISIDDVLPKKGEELGMAAS